MKTEISNELILQAHKEACSKWKSLIEKECPELFKKKFEQGKWYIHCDKIAMFLSNGNQDGKVGVGINGVERWTNEYFCHEIDQVDYSLATPTEIENHLIKVAKEKGFKEGVRVENVNGIQGVIGVDFKNGFTDYSKDFDRLAYLGAWVYQRGKWATIIEEPKVIELTMEDIAKLKGVDVSQIKIVK